VHRLILAAINPANTPHGYNWTFAFPMLLFIVIAAILYALFSRPHHRVPPRRISLAGAAAPRGAHVTGSVASSGGGTSKDAADEGGEQSAAPADADSPDGPETSA
jgi:hypothetical protein